MRRRDFLWNAALACVAAPLRAANPLPGFRFPSIDGGTLDTEDWRGRPALIVNTASLCGYTPQLEGMQSLHETYGPRGLVVLAVPSNDFRQELEGAEAVNEFCTFHFGLTLPMTDILHVRGPQAHPFYHWLREAYGFTPRWNFNKVLLGPDGAVVETWSARTKPDAVSIRRAFEPFLQ